MSNTICILHSNCQKEIFQIADRGKFQYKDIINVDFLGSGGNFTFYSSSNFKKLKIVIGNNSSIHIECTEHLISNLSCYASGENIHIKIGKNFSCYGASLRFYDKNSELIIGQDCMFSLGIYIWGTDGHSIYDLKTNELINGNSRKIVIGNHVWVGFGATILKGSYIPDNTVVGARALVCNKFKQPNAIIAGCPAKVLRTNIGWHRDRIDNFNI